MACTTHRMEPSQTPDDLTQGINALLLDHSLRTRHRRSRNGSTEPNPGGFYVGAPYYPPSLHMSEHQYADSSAGGGNSSISAQSSDGFDRLPIATRRHNQEVEPHYPTYQGRQSRPEVPWPSTSPSRRPRSTASRSNMSRSDIQPGTPGELAIDDPIVSRPNPQLLCEPWETTGCRVRPNLAEYDDWVQHHLRQHFHRGLPRLFRCWYCDHGVFEAPEDSRAGRSANFEARMRHIEQVHLRTGQTLGGVRRDPSVIDWSLDNQVIVPREYRRLQVSEMPDTRVFGPEATFAPATARPPRPDLRARALRHAPRDRG
jgi:hypothetical protein